MVQAIVYFKLSSDQGYRDAQFWYSRCLSEGLGIPPNADLALDYLRVYYLKLSASQQKADAQFSLGLANLNRISIPVNLDNAIHYLRAAASQGHLDAQIEFAKLISNNPTNDSDTNTEAVSYLHDHADSGRLDAIILYAKVLREGIITERNVTASASYMNQATDSGDMQSQYHYGMYLLDEGDQDRGIYYLKLSADSGYARVQMKYGMCLLTGRGIAKDDAVCSFKIAADHGDAVGQCCYGAYLTHKDPSASLDYLRLAASQGHSDAQNLVGMALLDGNGTEVDEAEAVEFFRLSAAQGCRTGPGCCKLTFFKGGQYGQRRISVLSRLDVASDEGRTQSSGDV
jgi:TPR repeat protein